MRMSLSSPKSNSAASNPDVEISNYRKLGLRLPDGRGLRFVCHEVSSFTWGGAHPREESSREP